MRAFALEIPFSNNGKEETIYPAVIQSGSELLLVDCGYPEFTPLISNALGVQGFQLCDITSVILTHHDIDHIGALPEIIRQYPSNKIYASTIEARYINGTEKMPRLLQAQSLYESLPSQLRPGALAFMQMHEEYPPTEINGLLEPGDKIFEGVEVISTSGHSPGHISLHLPQIKTLIAGDAFIYENGKFGIANPEYTLDLNAAYDSISKLSELDLDRVICYHGGVAEKNVKELFLSLLKKK